MTWTLTDLAVLVVMLASQAGLCVLAWRHYYRSGLVSNLRHMRKRVVNQRKRLRDLQREHNDLWRYVLDRQGHHSPEDTH